MSDFLTQAANGFLNMLSPLETCTSIEGVALLCADLGWPVDDLTTDASNSATALIDAVTELSSVITQVQQDLASGNVSGLLSCIQPVVNALGTNFYSQSAAFPPLADPTFPLQVFDLLVCRELESSVPLLYTVLRFLGLIEVTPVAATAERLAYTEHKVNWSELAAVLTNPDSVFATAGPYGWGGSLDYSALMSSFRDALAYSGLPPFMAQPTAGAAGPDSSLAADYYGTTDLGTAEIAAVEAPLYYAVAGSTQQLADLLVLLAVIPIPASGSQAPPPVGFAIAVIVEGQLALTIPLNPTLTLTLSGDLTSSGAIRAELRPGAFQITTGGQVASVDATATISAANPDGTPWYLIGDQAASLRVELYKWHVGLTVSGDVGSSTGFTFRASVGLDQLGVVIDFSQADGFLATLLGSADTTINLTFDVGWSTGHGLDINSQAKLSATLPLHATLGGVIDLSTATVGLGPSAAGGAELDVTVTGSLTLGPITVTVTNLGLRLTMSGPGQAPPQTASTPAPPDLAFAFRPPDGLGLAVDASVASGGGYIAFDPAQQQYAGVFSLALDLPIVTVQVYAAGVVDTQVPGGQPGYSFLLLLVAQFDPGFQLGFGFELDGVGGLVGINRSMAFDALRAAFNSHSLDETFFPSDPQSAISNVQQTISDLSSIFPISEGQTVFGPMLSLGWGTPLIVSADFGGVLELPTLRLALFGLFTVGLPTVEDPDLALVLLHIDILGEIDFDQDQLSIDGTLYDSHVIAFSLSGQFALRLNWGGQPEFALSIGGLNPQFQPPAGFPALQRLMISLGSGGVSLSLSCYFGVTSNSVQTGADLELHASAGSFSVHGYLAFDALFIFSPFSFAVDMRAGVDILQGSHVLLGIDLDLSLSGPSPWHAHGDAKFQILFFSVSASVDVTIGSASQAPPLPAASVWPLLQAAWQDPSNWSTAQPAGTANPVSFSPGPASGQTVLADPMGQLAVHEKVVPLDFTISQFGSAAPGDYNRFDVLGVTLNGDSGESFPISQDYFAPGQFEALSDGDKLSQPSYQLFDAIITIGPDDLSYSSPLSSSDTTSPSVLDVHYTTYYVEDRNVPAVQAGSPYRPPQATQLALAGQGAAANSPARNTGRGKYVAPGVTSPVATADVSYVIASTSSLRVDTTVSGSPWTSQAAAEAALAAYLSADPQAQGTLQVIPAYEAAP
jgi:hypothetical protein